jgi:hypothetical protein
MKGGEDLQLGDGAERGRKRGAARGDYAAPRSSSNQNVAK